MNTSHKYIAILRGINVGGHRKILMADLKQMFAKLGFTDVTTYIQSGNVVFTSDLDEKPSDIANLIERKICTTFDFFVPVIIRSSEDFKKLPKTNPLFTSEDCDTDRLHLTFLSAAPEKERINEIKKYDFSPDKFEIIDDNIFLFISGKLSDTKITHKFLESKLGVIASNRNWRTVNKLIEISKKTTNQES